MKKEKGFTLVELLGVIIILAVIALIVTPITINVIQDVQKNAFKNTAYGLIDAVKLEYAENYLNGNTEDLFYRFPEAEGLTYSGTVPDGGTIRLMADGKVSLAIHNNKWCATKGKDESSVSIVAYKENKCLLPEEANVPIITLNGDDSIYLDIGVDYVDPGYRIKTVAGEELSNDLVNITVKGQFTENTEIDTSVEEIYTITYTVTYKGITSFETRTVHVGNYKPTIQIEPNGTNGYESVSEVIITVSAFEQYSIDGFQYVITKDDVIGETVTVDGLSQTIMFTEDGIYTIKVIATDSDGNTNEFISEVYQIDMNEPVITFAEGDTEGIRMTVSEVASYDLKAGVTLTDSTVTIEDMEVIGNLSAMVGYYTVTYTVTDKAGNTSTKLRKVYVISDTSVSEGVYISEVKYRTDKDADLEKNQAQAYQTTLDGSIGLSDSNSDSEITLTVTVLNNTDCNYQLLEIVRGGDFDSSEDITYSIEGLSDDAVIPMNGSVTFDVTFKYSNSVDISEVEHEFDVSLKFDFREILSISYEYITNNGYPTTVLKGTDFVVDFVSHIPEGIYIKNVDNYSYTSPRLTIKNVQNDMVISNTLAYEHSGSYVFDGTNYIDTGVKLFNTDNFDRNFEVLFTISSYGATQEEYGSLFNCMDEVNLDYPGVVFRVNAAATSFELVANNKVNDFVQGQELPAFNTVTKVRVLRIDDIIYYSFNDGEYYEFQDFSVFNEYFDIPVTFGSSLDENGDPWRYFNGTLSNMQIRFLDDNIDVDSYISPYYLAYRLKGTSLVLDGTNYVDTGVYLFNEENAHKDFRMRFTVVSSNETQESYATLVNSLNEANADYLGLAFRIYSNTSTEFQIVANDVTKLSERFDVADVQKVEILRKDDILYYSINGGGYIEFQDYSEFVNYFEVPVTLGASLDADGDPYRYFVGTISKFDISIK